ncbi:MAG: hypothetical protein M3527_00990 [Actinomycetota bacterium]|nr:hypothetical protein [Acidimicrobiia bacterium]MDQ3293017.1 hypothetical protein [Actinomycetota bacterium]
MWNAFLGPLLYVSDQDSYTLPEGLNFFQGLFFVAQRTFTQGGVLTSRR